MTSLHVPLVGRDCALVEAITLNRRVVGSTPALAVIILFGLAQGRDIGQVLYLQLPVRFGVKLQYSIRAVVGSASEQWRTCRGAIEMPGMNDSQSSSFLFPFHSSLDYSS